MENKSTKSLVNSNTNAYFAPNNDDDDAPLAGDRRPDVDEQSGIVESQTMEFVEAEVVKEAEVVEEPKVVEPTPTPAPSNDFENDEF